MPTKKRASTTRRTTGGTRRRTTTTTRRRTRSTPTAVGSALGVALATFLVDMSWPARLGLIALLVVVVAAYVLVKARHAPPGESESAPEGVATQVDAGPKA